MNLRWNQVLRLCPALSSLLLFVSLSCEELEGTLCPGGTVLCGADYKCVDKTLGEGYECTRMACGDGKREEASGEQCDDGNNLNGDGCGSTCKLEECGNKVRDPGEPCDPSAGDKGCNKNCTLGSCGDGKLDALEACDPGQNDQLPASRACRKDCTGTLLCGNGRLDDGEECDPSIEDAGQVNCGPTCLFPACGNGVRDTGEACDDGNREEDYTCSADCSSDNTCGNGLIDNRFGPGDPRNEACDDGQRTDSKGCKNACKTATGCKNNKKDSWEECDPTAPGTEPGDCDDDCSRPQCGDGKVNVKAGEQCEPQEEGRIGEQAPIDQAGNTAQCNSVSAGRAACQKPACGDGWVNEAAGEQCDNGERGDTAECNSADANAARGSRTVRCRIPECGDGYVNRAAGEECDLGPLLVGKDWAGCNGPSAGEHACKLQRCGDGYVHDDECGEYDAFDEQTGVGCNGASAPTAVQCKPSVCGDGYPNATAGEVCDPGTADTRACNGPQAGLRACQLVQCGDGYTNQAAGEACDPGDPTPGNELTKKDEESDAWADCNGVSAGALACTRRRCGDGFAHPREGCDVGNNDTASCNSTTNERGEANPEALACSEVRCGDGYVNVAAGETCDPGDKPLTNDKDWVGDKEHPQEFCNGPEARDRNGQNVGCRLMECGDGYTHVSECGEADGIGCNGVNAPQGLDCRPSRCGDKYANFEDGELCDEGDADTPLCNGSGAGSQACQLPRCGDGYANREAGEHCDPTTVGADTATCNGKDAGAASCKKPTCGDRHPNLLSTSGTDKHGMAATEQCDNGAEDSAACNGADGNSACQWSTCGDGRVNRADGEECDPNADPSLWDLLPEEMNADGSLAVLPPRNGCNPDGVLACKRARCGDGYVNVMLLDDDPNTPFERCDPNAPMEEWFGFPSGDPSSFPTECNTESAGALKCQFAACGDGVLSAGEECDPGTASIVDADGNAAHCNGPNAPPGKQCRVSSCGDGYHNGAALEQCDDGTATLVCTATCVRTTGCGDGILNEEVGEECEKREDGTWRWCNAPEDLPGAGDEVHCKQYGYCGDKACNLRIELFDESERKCSWQIVCSDCDAATVPLREQRMVDVKCN